MDVDVTAQPNVNGDEDPYKPEGHIQFKLDKLTEFAALSDDRGRRLSEPVYIRGLPWRILALSRRAGRPREARVPVLGFFLQCNADNPDSTWSCTASYTLKVLPQDEGREAHERRIGHRFQANENDWGFAQFMTIEELKDPQRGWYRQADDSILLASDVLAEVPQGVNYEAKRGTIKFPSASPTLLSSVEQIGGFEWQVLPPEPDSPSHLVIVCNQQQSTTQQQQQQQLWFCEAKVQVRVKVTEVHWDNVAGGRAVKHCFNSFNKFNIRFKQPGERRVVQPQNIEVDIEVKWSAINLPNADLTVNYNGKSTLIPVNRSAHYLGGMLNAVANLFLAIHSNYFNNLFCGDWREQSKPGNSAASSELENLRQLNEDEHFDMTAFQFMINATHVMGPMLTKELPFPCWSTEDMQTKLALLKLAVKYDLPVCAEFAKRALIARRSNCTELLELLEVADGLGFCDLKQHSLQHVKAAEYCSKNFGQNCEIRGRLRQETRQELDARIEATTANFSEQPPINVAADVDCFDVKTTAQ